MKVERTVAESEPEGGDYRSCPQPFRSDYRKHRDRGEFAAILIFNKLRMKRAKLKPIYLVKKLGSNPSPLNSVPRSD